MVDSITPSGQVQNLLSPNNKAQKSTETQKRTEATASIDEVAISDEALSLAQVESAARQASEQLSAEGSSTLSNNQERLNALI